jgi:transcriptional regulator with XRE-family HTH domain
MILLRRVIGDALRARRQAQHRTLREVSTAANVSLGYLSEIERGQKEASSELLAAVCDALGARLSELLHEVSSTVASSERGEKGAGAPERGGVPEQGGAARTGVSVGRNAAEPAMAGAGDRDAAKPAMAGMGEGRSVAEPAMAGIGKGRGASKPVALATVPKGGRAAAQVAQADVSTTVDGHVSVTIRRETPLSTTLRTRTIRRDVLSGV